MPGGAALTGPAPALPRYIARWRFAYRAYDYTSPLTYTMMLRLSGLRMHRHAPEQLPDGAALIGPTIAPACTGTIARWRCAYRAYDCTDIHRNNCPMALRLSGLRCTGMHRNNCPMALRLSGLRLHWHTPEQLPDGAALIGPTIAPACTGTIARWRCAYRAYDCTGMHRNKLPDGAALIGPTMVEMARSRRPDKAQPPSGTFSFIADSFTAGTPGTNKRALRRASSSQ